MSWAAWDEAAYARRRKDTKASAPAFTSGRDMAVADALDPKVRERIHEEAKDAAAEIMRDWEGRR